MTYQRETISTELKDELLVEAMHRCCLCPQHEDITEIHHVVPIRERGPNTKENLMVVCPTCHAKIHRIRTMYTPKQLKMYKERWVNLCAKGLPLEERMIKAPGLPLSLKSSLHNQTPPEPKFVGQVDKLTSLTNWYNDPKVRIGALIGWGGVGKSALVRKWYDSLEENDIHPDGIFWWGFYRNAYLDQFLNALLRYVSQEQIEPESIKSTWEKVERLKEYLHQGTYLLVLDGVEQMQKSASGDEFGRMIHRECTELLHDIADVAQASDSGLCLITTRYPLKDLDPWRERSYKEQSVTDLSIPDSLKMLRGRGVKGSDEDITAVITRYKGHALSLTSLAGYLTRYYEGDINQAPDITFILSDKERFKEVNKLLRKYAEKMSEPERVFLLIFSLFRSEVTEDDFAIAFRHRVKGTDFNAVLVKTNELDFRDLVSGLVDWRLISYDETKKTYTTHPLIKSYFESTFDEVNKKLCHKHLYQYFGLYAPVLPETLEEMQPLFEQVYHGCAAGLYDEVFDDVYWEKIQRRGEFFITNKLAAWEANLSLILYFFPLEDFQKDPCVSNPRYKSWLINEAGFMMVSLGRLEEVLTIEGLFKKAIELDISQRSWRNASYAYQNLAEVQILTGNLLDAKKNANEAIRLSREAEDIKCAYSSVTYLAYTLFLLAKIDGASIEFKRAYGLQKEAHPLIKHLCSIRGIQYVDFLLAQGKIDEVLEVTQENLKICERENWIDDISLCHRSFASIYRYQKRFKEAEENATFAIEGARKTGRQDIWAESLIELAKIRLDQDLYQKAESTINQVLQICTCCGYRLYEPEAEIVLSKAYLALNDIEQAETFALSAYDKAIGMKYRWPEGDAAHLLGEVYLAMNEKEKAREWLERAVECRKEILDPEVKESEELLERL